MTQIDPDHGYGFFRQYAGPNGVFIPGVFSLWNDVSLYGVDPKKDYGFRIMLEKGSGADHCVECGACEAACPQHLPIIEQLKLAWAELTKE